MSEELKPRHGVASVRGRPALSLRLGRFDPPHEILRKARKRSLKRLATLTDRLAVGRQCLYNRSNRERTRHHHHAHFGERAVPGGCGARARETSGRIARDSGGAPKPLLKKMVGEVFQTRL